MDIEGGRWGAWGSEVGAMGAGCDVVGAVQGACLTHGGLGAPWGGCVVEIVIPVP